MDFIAIGFQNEIYWMDGLATVILSVLIYLLKHSLKQALRTSCWAVAVSRGTSLTIQPGMGMKKSLE
jgi:hypothetical protein